MALKTLVDVRNAFKMTYCLGNIRNEPQGNAT